MSANSINDVVDRFRGIIPRDFAHHTKYIFKIALNFLSKLKPHTENHNILERQKSILDIRADVLLHKDTVFKLFNGLFWIFFHIVFSFVVLIFDLDRRIIRIVAITVVLPVILVIIWPFVLVLAVTEIRHLIIIWLL